MAVSVRMNPLLEKELEQAARRLGVTKSQFIIDAVQRALGRNNPYELLLQVQREHEPHPADASDAAPADDAAESTGERLRQRLRRQHEQQARDWLAYQQARKKGVPWTPDDESDAARG